MTERLTGVAATAKGLLDSVGDDDPEAAARLTAILPELQEVAESGDIGAQNVLGGILLEFEENPTEAALWFTHAANQGSAVGRRSLGHLYATGLGVEQDLAQAENLFREAADAGDAHAQFNLAQMWWEKRDPQTVISLLRSAAVGGVVDAFVVLGDLLGAMDEDTEALDCYLKAAEAGHDGAMYVAACWFRDGTAGSSDKVEALKWFFRMLEAGNADGIHEAIIMARGMTDEDIRRAGRLSGRPGDAEAMVGTVSKYR
ncbi:tetratricopeptide repeat protein [Streptomyces sp. NPDC006678]|uniref:tetratricopeptide repeat protein n=1 Tax=Streptomyces sp. NPDC006678 TaxID=3157185 RepID=UPI0033DC0BA7